MREVVQQRAVTVLGPCGAQLSMWMAAGLLGLRSDCVHLNLGKTVEPHKVGILCLLPGGFMLDV